MCVCVFVCVSLSLTLSLLQLNDKNKKDCVEAESKCAPSHPITLTLLILATHRMCLLAPNAAVQSPPLTCCFRYANSLVSQGQALKKRTAELEQQVMGGWW